ncbi:MAG: hypothetical protein ACTHW1_05970 [Ancrocorticia sp.]|uniref:hypothetical protein n=1 Tax=Ancrocorticia sp. TaxID=2593684 RepID=UPI003F8DDA24
MTIIGVATLAIGGVVGTQIAGETSADASEQAKVDSSQPQSEEELRTAAIGELEENKTVVMSQQSSERTEAAAILTMPTGVEFGEPESFDEIDSQIAALKSGELNPSTDEAGEDKPTLLWYEDGFFASLMAIDWKCGWLSTGINQVKDGDAAEVQETVDMLHWFTTTEYASMFPDYEEFLTYSVDPLLDGDTTGAEEYLPNCLPETIAE